MEEISLTEFINSLGASYQKIFDLLDDDTFVSLAKEVAPLMKEKGLTAETILFDEEIKAKLAPVIDGSEDKLLAMETLLKGLEHLENYLEEMEEGNEDAASRMVTYYMIQYILSKKANKNVQ
jgi:CRISPR/Cas system CMR-associated protein Cmr5 small subunit